MAVTRIAYEQSWYRKAEDCLRAIRFRTDQGWQVSEVRGPEKGPFVVIFRQDGSERREAVEPTG